MTNLTPHIKVLLIEEDANIVHQVHKLLVDASPIVSAMLKAEILRTARLEPGLAYLAAMRFDVVLMSPSLPDSQGTEAFLQVKAAAPTVPILILSKQDDEGTAVQIMLQGAQGYLLNEQLNAHVLASLLLLAVEQKRLRSNLAQTANVLQSRETSCRELLDKLSDGLVVVNKDGMILFVNSEAETLLAGDKKDLLGKPFDFPLTLTDTTRFDLPQKNGGTVVIKMRQIETQWENQDVHMIFLRNITEHQQAKRELTLKAGKLEARNAELDAFARTTAHQIQGLLSQMIGYTSYLEMHYGPTLDDEVREVLRHVLRSGHKMSNVLSELLLLAFVEKEDIPFAALDMGRIVSEAQKRMAIEIEEQNGKLSQPDSWPIIFGYGSWIEEAWVNYISNGLKYGGTLPQIKLGWDNAGNGMLRFWVKDDGPGIEPDDQKRLFKPHIRLHEMRATGEGLGLSIVRRIIQKCGGEVGVESTLGEGSTFWFTLPIAEEDKVQV